MKQELVPIFRIPRSNAAELDAHATGTLMHIDDKYFLATASHVFRHSDLGALMIGSSDHNIVIKRDAIVAGAVEQDREADSIDFGIVMLNSKEVASLSKCYHFLDVMELVPLDHDDINAYCHISGFPCIENSPCHIEATLIPQLYRIDCTTDKRLLAHSCVKRHKQVPDDYIALRYDPRKILKDSETDLAKLKHVNGMSGGAIYAGHSPFNSNLTGEKIVSKVYNGMLLEKHKCRTGEILIYGLSLLAIKKILNIWIGEGIFKKAIEGEV